MGEDIGKVLLLCPLKTCCCFQAFCQPSNLQSLKSFNRFYTVSLDPLGKGQPGRWLLHQQTCCPCWHLRLLISCTSHCLSSTFLHSREMYLHKLQSFQGKHDLPSHQEGSLHASWRNQAKQGSTLLYCPTRVFGQMKTQDNTEQSMNKIYTS